MVPSIPQKIYDRAWKSSAKLNAVSSWSDVQVAVMKTLTNFEEQTMIINQNSTLDSPIPVYCLQRIPGSEALIVSDECGYVYIVPEWFNPAYRSLVKKPPYVSSIYVAENSAVTSIYSTSDHMVLGTTGGDVVVMDMEFQKKAMYLGAHSKAIRKVTCYEGNPSVIVTCGRDDMIGIFDLRVRISEPVNFILTAHSVREGTKRNQSGLGLLKSNRSSIADVVFSDENTIISAGTSDGRLKQWDLRVSYRHMKLVKVHPVRVVEFPGDNRHVKGYTCVQTYGSNLFASSANFDIFQFNIATLSHDVTYVSPSKFNNYCKFDVSRDGSYLACGSSESKVHVFKTVSQPCSQIDPIHTLAHKDFTESAVCCALFSHHDDLMLTTGNDISEISRWIPLSHHTPSSDLEKIHRKLEIENKHQFVSMKNEFTVIRSKPMFSPSKYNITRGFRYKTPSPRKKSASESSPRKRSPKRLCFSRLDSFPNYVLDGMNLPHVFPKIKLKGRLLNATSRKWLNVLSPENVLKSPSGSNVSGSDQEVTPKRRTPQSRKRRKVSNLSPKILHYFSVSPSLNSSGDHLC